jgi:hypothetical protein
LLADARADVPRSAFQVPSSEFRVPNSEFRISALLADASFQLFSFSAFQPLVHPPFSFWFIRLSAFGSSALPPFSL